MTRAMVLLLLFGVCAACDGPTGYERVPLDPLLDPSSADEPPPETFLVRFETTVGDFVVRFHRDWSSGGTRRVYNLVKIGFYDGSAFHRVLAGRTAQFGFPAKPTVARAWKAMRVGDEPPVERNRRGTVTFARAELPDSRTFQLFINLNDNADLDRNGGFPPVGEVIEGMSTVDALHAGYGESPPDGNGPHPSLILERGSAYLRAEFPKLTFIERAVIVEE